MFVYVFVSCLFTISNSPFVSFRLQELAKWLNQNPNYNEVTKWYKGWKNEIGQGSLDLLSAPQVQHQLQQALDMMTRVSIVIFILTFL